MLIDANEQPVERLLLSSLVLFLIAIAVRLIGIDGLPRIDELFTFLAARGWLAEGAPRIADGLYPRAELYTMLVGEFFRAFGESPVVARLPSVLAGSALVVAVFWWTRARAGTLAGWIAGLLAGLSPLGILIGQYARFYALFGLLFWLGATGVFALVERRRSLGATVTLGPGVLLAFALSYALQPLTLIGLIAVALWLVLCVVLPWLLAQRQRPQLFWSIVIGGGVLGALALLVLLESGIATELVRRYRWSPLHSADRQNAVWFYHLSLTEYYPSLWPLFPFIALLAIAMRPQPALFCSIVFAVSFALLSLGGMKHFHYLFFVEPFLFVVWAIALAPVLGKLARWSIGVVDRAVQSVAPGLPQRPTRWILFAVALLFLLLANGAPARTILKPFGVSLGSDESDIDWRPLKVALQPWLKEGAVVLTPHDLHALYYLGDYDVAVNRSRLTEIHGQDFAIDERFGRPVIGSPEALALIIDCRRSGLLVADSTMYRVDWALDNALANQLERQTVALDLTVDPRLHAFYWRHGDDWSPEQARCRDLPDLQGN